jgi:hypothetical protein
MSEFPLYNSLKKGLPKKDLTVKQKEDFLSKVAILDLTGKELVYILICAHHNTSKPDDQYEEMFPYGSEQSNSNETEFDFAKFPLDLRQMLYKFVLMHVKKMDEEKIRVIQQNSPSI